jgi:hypothetical protein
MSSVLRQLQDIYGPVAHRGGVNTPSVHAEGSSTTGTPGNPAKGGGYRFDGNDPSDLDTLVMMRRRQFDQLYNEYLRAKYPNQMRNLEKYLGRADLSIHDIDVNMQKVDGKYPSSGYGKLRSVRQEYDKGILRGKDMVDIGWVDPHAIEEIERAVGRKTTVSIICEDSPFDPESKNKPKDLRRSRKVDLSTVGDEHVLDFAAKVTIVVVGIGVVVSVSQLIQGIICMAR